MTAALIRPEASQHLMQVKSAVKIPFRTCRVSRSCKSLSTSSAKKDVYAASAEVAPWYSCSACKWRSHCVSLLFSLQLQFQPSLGHKLAQKLSDQAMVASMSACNGCWQCLCVRADSADPPHKVFGPAQVFCYTCKLAMCKLIVVGWLPDCLRTPRRGLRESCINLLLTGLL